MKKILCLIATEDRLWNMRRALKRVEETCPGLLSGCCWSLWDLCANPEKTPAMLAEAAACDFAIIYFHGGTQMLEGFPKVWQAITQRMPVYFESSLPQEIAELMPASGLTEGEYRELQQYFRFGDAPNFYGMLLRIARDRFGAEVSIPEPMPPLEEGFYDHGRVLTREETEARIALAARGEKPAVGLILHQSQIVNDNTRHIDATLTELDRLGAVTLPLFTRMSSDEDETLGIRGAMERYFTLEGRPLPDVILVLTGFSLTHMGRPGDGVREMPESIFSFCDVPAIQVMLTRFTPEDYVSLPQGIDSMSLTSHVVQPEMDGQIISVPNAAQVAETGPEGERKLFAPLADRVERICRLAMNWAKLRRTPAGEKRIAILFNTMPGNDKIGCAEGLDTFESVRRMVEALRGEGVETDFSFDTAQALADAVTAGLTNDLRWTSREAMEEKAAAVIPPETWRGWFGALSDKVKEELSRSWGRAPGEVMALDDRLLIPGLLCGHIFIGLQPSRAYGERAEQLYHSTDSTPPYSYLAYYRWLEECFGADCVVHVGTHGTLEWTPGKEVGLSRDCWPDACLGSLPHLYPYHIGIVGEGIQAKRRSWAVILDHMPPSLDEAESYEGLAVIDEALKEYHQARQVRPAQVPALARRIFDMAAQEHLCQDLGLDEEKFRADPQGAVETIHLWMGELKNSLVKDGLHIFGQVPEGTLYENRLRALVRVKNGSVPALTDSVVAALGYDPEALKDSPAADFGGVSGLELRDRATNAARRMVSALAAKDYDPAAIDYVVEKEGFPGVTADLRRVLGFLCTTVTDKLDHVTDEMRYFLAGFAGRFVPPALGGNPTRGNVSILPTGRNFYASDPAQIPSRAAWEIGGRLARQLLDQYAEAGEGVPESVAMVVWAGNTVKTSGEDFAECLQLMGVRPVYLGESSCVAGVEPIPLEELGRPRIDVTLRISGLFRDMYPNLIRLMDQALTCVGTLDEPEERNFIRKHLREDVEALTSQGIPRDQALDEAYLRVYGCAPGCYGTAVAKIIDSRQWTDFRDLARVFETWSSYGYSGREHGEKHTEAFRRRMSTVAVTVKN